MTLTERLAKLSHPEGACRVWHGRIKETGYGQVRVKRADGWHTVNAHRAAFEAATGRPAQGDVDHIRALCPTGKPCIEPTHLRDWSPSENRSEGARYRWFKQGGSR